MSLITINKQAAAVVGRILLKKEPALNDIQKWIAIPYEKGITGFVKFLMASDEFIKLNLNNKDKLTSAYNGIMTRIDAAYPVDIDHWVNRLNFEKTIDNLVDEFGSIKESGYQNDACGSPVDASATIKAHADSAGKPLIFTLGTNRHLYLFKFDSVLNRYAQLDLSEQLTTPKHGKVQSFDTFTDDAGNICIAIAICPRRGNPYSSLYLIENIAQSTTAEGWLDAFKKATVYQGMPAESVVSNVSFGTKDGSGKQSIVISLAIKGVMNNYYFFADEQAKAAQYLRIPQDGDKVLMSSIGTYRKPGVWSLYMVGADAALTFSTFPDGYGKTININYENLPPNIKTFNVNPGAVAGIPNLYVAGDGISVYRSSHAAPEVIIEASKAPGITFMAVNTAANFEQIWYVDQTRQLQFVSRQTGGASWSAPQVIESTTDGVAFVDSFNQPQPQLALITPGRSLLIGSYDAGTSLWTNQEIELTAVWDEIPLTKEELQKAIQDAAPKVYFDTEEQYKSSTVEFYLKQVGLWNYITNGWQIEPGKLWDDTNSDINPDALKPMPRSAADGSTKHDCDYTLKIPDADQDKVRPGAPDKAPLYVHAKFIPEENSTDLIFWIFCPYNGPGTLSISGKENVLGQLGVHEGDLEHFLIRIDNDSLQLTKVYLSQHDSGGWFTPAQLEIDPDSKRVILYTSRNGHAFYTSESSNANTLFETTIITVSLVNRTTKGTSINVWEPGRFSLISAGFLGSDVPQEAKWLEFPWRWGRYFEFTPSDIREMVQSTLESIEPPGGFLMPVNAIIGGILGEIAVSKNWLGGDGNSAGPEPIKLKGNWFEKE
ncbi:MAG: hypothetical protein JWR38_929 [Mucilaginibacter sp.]|nr:hypothetical protein [Mucilaginibacter sp.]